MCVRNVFVSMYARTYVVFFNDVCVDVCMYEYGCMDVCGNVCMYVCMSVCIYVCCMYVMYVCIMYVCMCNAVCSMFLSVC